jgi:hypothetical protein
MKTRNLRGTLSRGITVTTNDPARSTVHLSMRAHVVGSVVLSPRTSLSVSSGQIGQSVDRILLKKDPTEQGALNVTGVTASKPWLRAEVRRVEQPEPAQGRFPAADPGDWVLEVGVGDGLPAGTNRESVRFKTGLPREPEVTVPVLVRVVPPITVRPRRLVLADPGTKKRAEGELMAVVRNGKENQEFSVDAAPETFEVRLEQTGTRHYRAFVTWDPEGPESPRSGVVTLRLGEETVSVPVTVRRPAPPPSQAPKSRSATGR